MVTRSARALTTALFLAGVLCVKTSFATPPVAGDQAVRDELDAKARAAFEEGLAALHASDWKLAEARFRRSLELVARPSARYNLAFVLFQQDRPRESLAELEALLAETGVDPSYREHAEVLTARVRARLSGEPAQPAGDAKAADPRIPATAAGSPPAAPLGQTSASEAGSKEPPAERTSTISSWGPWASLGVGGALLVAGSITGILALRADDRFAEGCPELTDCDRRLLKDSDHVTRLGRITDVLLISGATFVVGGVTWRVVAPPPAERLRARQQPAMVTMTVRY